MLDFVKIVTTIKETRTGRVIKIRPKFIVNHRSKDLMIKGGDFYAVWDERKNLWSTDEQDVNDLIDTMIKEAVDKCEANPWDTIEGCYMWDSDSGSVDKWHKFVQKQMRDNFVQLDQSIIFSNSEVKREDYASKKLEYALAEGNIDAYEELISTLYDPDEREKIEWAIGSIVAGDSKHIQKFEVLYGDKGTGKGTVLDIIDLLFDGYTASFNAKDLANANNAFALESLKGAPLVAINGDGDLSRIEDNTKINMLVSHEKIEVNSKYSKIYTTQFKAFLFMGTNRPVKITDPKSGILRRLIDVHPSGRKIPYRKYHNLRNQVKFERGGIAFHCLEVYKELGEDYYEDYVPLRMMAETNDFYDFIEYHIEEYEKNDLVTLSEAWGQYDEYCKFANAFKIPYRIFRSELSNYFRDFKERMNIDGKYVRSVYVGFRSEKFENPKRKKIDQKSGGSWLVLDQTKSLFDEVFADCPAQGCKEDGSPLRSWKNVTGRLSEIDTSTLHWVKPPENLICIDFDIKGLNGEKDLAANMEAAGKFKPTYAEVSKSGKAIHLYYYYDGDVSELSSLYEPYIEVKTFLGGASLRRIVTACNALAIAVLSVGSLPLKEKENLISEKKIEDEKHLRACILKALRKEIKPGFTSTCVNYIKKVTDEAYESGIQYDVTDLQKAILTFAGKSSNQADRCVNLVGQMHLRSEEAPEVLTEADIHMKFTVEDGDGKLVFFDIEIYRPDEETDNPGLFLICWKYENAEDVSAMINPKPYEVEMLISMLLVGFNNRAYDNPMIYAASIGYSNQQLYDLSQELIVRHHNPFPRSADLSYLDVFDVATEKMGLKKWEYKLGILHKEMGIPWDQPAPKERWNEIISYCMNDVRATEAVFHARQGDFMARKIQVALVELLHPGEGIKVCVNDTTNTLSKRIIFGRERNPQKVFNYRDLSKPVGSDRYEEYREKFGEDYKFRVFDNEGLPRYRDYIPGEVLPEGWSILPFFPGYLYAKNDKGRFESTYLGEIIGEGGKVYSVPGYYEWVLDLDVSSMHPHSMIAEVLFGKTFTKILADIVKARVAVKHRDFETAGSLLGGALKPYLSEEYASDLAQALKIVINSIYGLTSAKFENEFRDPRNVDNIVAKRGALFMTLLKREVEKFGANVCHIKTDSIKIPNASDEIKDFVIRFGREFGYEFEIEAIFVKFALFNDAAYLGMEENGHWETKADQFKAEKQPFLFKTLFSHEPYEFKDFCETKSVTDGALYLDMNEDLGEPVDEEYDKAVKKLVKIGVKIDSELPTILAQLRYDDEDDLWISDHYSQELREQYEICKKLHEDIPNHHNFVFVGRVGQFTPIKDGYGGGVLYRKDDTKISAATGSKGHRWLESSFVEEHGMMDAIDMSYYQKKVDKAKEAIEKIVDVDYFISDQIPEKKVVHGFMNIPEYAGDTVPFDEDYILKGGNA